MTPEEIITDCCSIFGISEEDMPSRSRKIYGVVCRAFIVHFLRKYTNLSYKKIGGYVDRDHSNVIHLIQTVEVYKKMDKVWFNFFYTLDDKFSGKQTVHICPTCGHAKIQGK